MAIKGIRRPEKALTALQVNSAREPGKYFDGHGLFLRVQANGSRQWVQRITIRGKRCELGLGNPSLVSLAEAREKALANRKLAVAGGDPIRAKREAEAVLTFEEAARKVHALHLPTWRNAKHGAQFISTLETYAFQRMAAQMVAVHVCAMDSSRRYLNSESYPGKDSAERAMNKLTRTFTMQMETLKRYRSKGQQVVRVERVTVHEGGQAIVGAVAHGGRGSDGEK